MNIAIITLVIFVIVAPAIIARRVYFTRELSSAFIQKNTLKEIFSAIFLASILHSLWIFVIEKWVGYKIDFDLTFRLLFDARSITNYSGITNSIYQIICYFFSQTIVFSFISYIFRNSIRLLKIDRRTEVFRYDNNWYYLFSGEVLDIKKYNEDENIDSSQVTQRVVDVLAKSTEEKVIYRGNLIDFRLNNENSVEYIVLSYPEKKIKGKDAKIINSNYFIIPFSEIVNINLRYLSVTENQESSNESESEED